MKTAAAETTTPSVHDTSQAHAGWIARLELGFSRRPQGSYLARRQQFGPLSLQKILYPEGNDVAHGIVLHPPGGIAGGDQLLIDVSVDSGAAALLTTPGATKWYRSAGSAALQTAELTVASAASLEWLPQENIVFDQALAGSHTRVRLESGARFIGWDICAFGRPAGQLPFVQGQFRQSWRIEQDGRLLWWEQGDIRGGDARFGARPGLQGYSVVGTLVAVGASPGAELLEELRALSIDGLAGVTLTPRGVLLLRCLAPGAEIARAYLTLAWSLLRPAYTGREAHLPRIWNT